MHRELSALFVSHTSHIKVPASLLFYLSLILIYWFFQNYYKIYFFKIQLKKMNQSLANPKDYKNLINTIKNKYSGNFRLYFLNHILPKQIINHIYRKYTNEKILWDLNATSTGKRIEKILSRNHFILLFFSLIALFALSFFFVNSLKALSMILTNVEGIQTSLDIINKEILGPHSTWVFYCAIGCFLLSIWIFISSSRFGKFAALVIDNLDFRFKHLMVKENLKCEKEN